MSMYICMILGTKLSTRAIDQCPSAALTLDGKVFRKCESPHDVIFYDWIIDGGAGVCGLEIHLATDDPILTTRWPRSQLSYITCDPFLRIWLTGDHLGDGAGKEAFGDIFFYKASDGECVIVVGVEDWLSPLERKHLLRKVVRPH